MTDTAESEATPALVLDFGEGRRAEFKAYDRPNLVLLTEHFDNLFSEGYHAARSAIILAVEQAVPEEREAVKAHLTANGRHDSFVDVIYQGLDGCWRGVTTYPSVPLSDSSTTTGQTDGGTSSTDASPSPATPATRAKTSTGSGAARRQTSTRASRSGGSSRPRTQSSPKAATTTS